MKKRMKREAVSSTLKGRERRSTRPQATVQTRRRSARLLAKASASSSSSSSSSAVIGILFITLLVARMDSRPLSSESSRRTVNLISSECVSLSSSETPKEIENVNISEVEKSGNESISILKDRSWLRESDRNSLSNTSMELRATIRHFSEAVSPPAQAHSPTAPSSYVKSHEIDGEKIKGCNNTRLAGTSIETSSASEGTFNSENFNAKLGAQNQGRKESDQDFPAAATIASNSALGRQVEEARDGMPDDVNNVTTTDEPLRQTYGTALSEFANLFPEDVSNHDEVESFLFDRALVTVEGYRVKEASALILRKVMEKHGDIAANCIMVMVENRSFFLEKLCEIIQTLQTTKFVDVKQSAVKKMLALVADLGRINLDVEWLQKRLEEILEAIEFIKQSSCFKESMERNAQTIQKSKRALRIYEGRMLTRKAQIRALKEKASLEKEKMDAAEAENRDILQRVSNLKQKVKRFIKESLLHDLE
ncbi:hypothetical protein PTKIN_Ptkin07bG0296600 [Pterospermum kingtungense]